MADRDWELVVRNALAPMAEKGLSRTPVFALLPSKNLSPLPTSLDNYTTFTRLLYVARTNINRTVANPRFCSHRSVIPISVRCVFCTIEIRQTRILSIGEYIKKNSILIKMRKKNSHFNENRIFQKTVEVTPNV